MKKIIPLLLLVIFFSCKNRDLNEGEEFRPREVHDSFNNITFSKVEVDGIEYLMLERDNNNPHEGFGFMAFRANKMVEKQDSLLAHIKTQGEIQSKMYAQLFGISNAESDSVYDVLFKTYLNEGQSELRFLEEEGLRKKNNSNKE